MLRRRIIPCLDVRRGRLVKGVRFRDLRDCGDPVDAAARYAEAGADEIVWLNISAGDEAWAELLRAVERAARRVDVPLCVGGGVDGFERARDLLLAGADKVSVNTAPLGRPELVEELADQLGSQCVVVAVDAARVNGSWEAHASAGTDAVRVPVIASGGAGGPADMAAALGAGAQAALAASIFHDGEATVADVKQEVAACGLPVRS